MTIAIVTAQGHGIADRRKTCARASTEGEGATWGTTAHEFASQRAHPARSTEDPRSPVRDLDVRDDRHISHDLPVAGVVRVSISWRQYRGHARA